MILRNTSRRKSGFSGRVIAQCSALVAGLVLAGSVWATVDTFEFSSPQQEQEYRSLTEMLRCPKCQNNNIADSTAIIATDMRQKVYELQQKGYSKGQIVQYMVDRYGNFVTYDPPLTPATLILWVAPLLFVLVGAGVIVARSRKGRSQHKRADVQSAENNGSKGHDAKGIDVVMLSAEEQARLDDLLKPVAAKKDES
ncbi:MAG: cytochrome c-type biogenesis protein [Plesiomonas sp.]|uniref:cytochrome c-type biogenesis protein n=1 Tax=Plesiomonas sp. TaxID=2486279 RepID=UPI003F37EBBF